MGLRENLGVYIVNQVRDARGCAVCNIILRVKRHLVPCILTLGILTTDTALGEIGIVKLIGRFGYRHQGPRLESDQKSVDIERPASTPRGSR